jgi:predicted RNA-binding Zn-ribbon protein involved in translation (DUF1610 family)
MTKFCFNCGHKLEYKFNPPNFCPNCGTNINETSSKKDEDIPACKTSIPSKASETSDGYTDSVFVPNISSLQYELDDFGASHQQTIGSLGGKQAPKRRQNNTKSIDDL